MRRFPLPIIAGVHGAVAGFGMSLLMACDLALAADDARFTLAYCHLGTSPDGGFDVLPATSCREQEGDGDRPARRSFDAATALRLGLVNDVVPAADLGPRVAELAARLARGPAAAYAATKRLLHQSGSVTIETQLQAEAENFARCAAMPDFAEGVAAFVAKRAAKFS